MLPTRPHAEQTCGHDPFQCFPPGAQSNTSGIPTRPQHATHVRGSWVSHPPRRTSSAFCSSRIFPFRSQQGGKQAPSRRTALSTLLLPGGICSLSGAFLSASFSSTAPWQWQLCQFVPLSQSMSVRLVHVGLSMSLPCGLGPHHGHKLDLQCQRPPAQPLHRGCAGPRGACGAPRHPHPTCVSLVRGPHTPGQ